MTNDKIAELVRDGAALTLQADEETDPAKVASLRADAETICKQLDPLLGPNPPRTAGDRVAEQVLLWKVDSVLLHAAVCLREANRELDDPALAEKMRAEGASLCDKLAQLVGPEIADDLIARELEAMRLYKALILDGPKLKQ
jgi:hypothetical protein